MAETRTNPLKRQREEEQETLVEETKRQKPSSSSYSQILSLLEETEEQDEPNHDLTSLITTLQQELSSDEPIIAFTETNSKENSTATSSDSSSSSSSCSLKEEEDEDDKERVMRHLLEASDDELGIPNTETFGSSEQGVTSDNNDGIDYNGGLLDGFGSFGDGLWELEDEAANYYTLLQSELFM